jgi:hypothetical protein
VKLFRMKPKPEDGAEEKELVLDTEDEATPSATVEAEAKAGESAAAATPEAAAGLDGQTPPSAAEADPLAQFRAEAAGEIAAGDEAPEGAPASPQPDDALDPDLLDIFREAKNEVEESTLASELPDIPIQELLGDLVSISQRLGISPQARPKPNELREGGK